MLTFISISEGATSETGAHAFREEGRDSLDMIPILSRSLSLVVLIDSPPPAAENPPQRGRSSSVARRPPLPPFVPLLLAHSGAGRNPFLSSGIAGTSSSGSRSPLVSSPEAYPRARRRSPRLVAGHRLSDRRVLLAGWNRHDLAELLSRVYRLDFWVSPHSDETGPDLRENKAEVNLPLLLSLRFSSRDLASSDI